MNNRQLQDRLIDFAVSTLVFSKSISSSYEGQHLRKQLIRSSTSAPLNYAEARSSQSRRDFLHKSKIILKELRETQVCIAIIDRAGFESNSEKLKVLEDECNQLTAIFTSTVKTTQEYQ